MAENASKKVLKALHIFGSVQMVGIACSLIRAKLISVWIGQAGVGLFGILNSTIELIATGTQLNLRQSAVRDLANAQKAQIPRIGAAIKWWALVLGLVGGAAMAILSPVLSLSSFGNLDFWWVFASLSIVMTASSVTNGALAIMQGTGQLKTLAKSTLYGSVAGTALSLPLYYLWGIDSIVPSLIIFALASLTAALTLQKTPTARISAKESISTGKGFVKLGTYLTLSSLAAAAASYVLKAYITQSTSIEATGLYQAGYTIIVSYVGIVFTAIGMEYYPRLSGIAMRAKMASKVVSHEMALLMCVLSPIVVIFVMVDDLIVRILYASDFLPIVPMIRIGIAGAIFRAASYCWSFVIVSRGDGKCFVAVEIASASIGLTLNILGYRYYGIAGLGMSYLAWYAIYAAMTWTVCRYRYGIKLSRKTAIILLASIVTTLGAIYTRSYGIYAPLPWLAIAAGIALWAKSPSKNAR